MFDWFTSLAPIERRTFWACFGGWALDAMDVQIYALVVPALIGVWHLTSAEVGQLGAAALFTSALGGWLAGLLSDRIGRVRTLQLSILWFALFTFLSGLTQSFGQLFLVRLLQGFGFGGEWAAGAVLMGEVIDARHRGKAGRSCTRGAPDPGHREQHRKPISGFCALRGHSRVPRSARSLPSSQKAMRPSRWPTVLAFTMSS